MQRRDFLKTAGAGAAAVAAGAPLAAPAGAQKRYEWNMVTPWPKGAPGVGVNAQRAADLLTTLSGGRLTVKLYGAGELVSAFEALDAVIGGAVDMLHGTPYYWQGKDPAFHWFTGVPLGLTATEFMGWYYFGDLRRLWEEAYAPLGVKPFYAGSSGVQSGGWFKREVNGLDDLRGLKFRIAGLGGEVMRRLGAAVVLLPPGEIFGALQQGTIDAAEWVGPWNDIAFGLHKVAKYYYQPAFHEPGPALELTVNRAKYEALPKDLQDLIEVVARATAAHTLADFTHHNIVSLEPLVAQHGAQLRLWPDDVTVAMGRATQAVLEETAAAHPTAGKVHASFKAYLTRARAWARWSDLAMLRMRETALG